MQRSPLHPTRVAEVRDGFELAHAMLGAVAPRDAALAALAPPLRAALEPSDPEAPRRAVERMKRRLTPADTRALDPRQKALLATEVGGATGRRWLSEAPPRPGFSAHPGVRACVRALALARTPGAPRETLILSSEARHG